MIHPDEQAIRLLREEHSRHLTELCQLDMSQSDAFKAECDRHSASVGRIYYDLLKRQVQYSLGVAPG